MASVARSPAIVLEAITAYTPRNQIQRKETGTSLGPLVLPNCWMPKVLLADCVHAKGADLEANAFVGTWRLVSWESRDADGQVLYPVGKDPVGYLTYSADGYMQAILTGRGRSDFAAGDLLHGTLEEQAAAAATCIAYAGRYSLQEGVVTHYVEASLFPNWVGSAQERFYEFEGDRLSLSTRPMLQLGRERRAFLVWERMRLPSDEGS